MYSPILSVLTAAFEITAAVFALKIKGRKTIRFTSAVLLLLLASYQILEIVICSGSQNNLLLSKLAFTVIIWLPSVGILLISYLFPVKKKVVFGYSILLFSLSILMVMRILLTKDFVTQTVCSVIFARYSNPETIYLIYSVIYELGLMSMLFLSAYGVIITKDAHQRKLLGQILLGSMAFIFSALITVVAVPITKGSLPSVMCHYALLLAIFISRLVFLESKNTEELPY